MQVNSNRAGSQEKKYFPKEQIQSNSVMIQYLFPAAWEEWKRKRRNKEAGLTTSKQGFLKDTDIDK